MNLHKRFIDLSKPLAQAPTGTAPYLSALDNIRLIAYDFYGTLFISGVGDIGVDDGKFDAQILASVLRDSGLIMLSPEAAEESMLVYNTVVTEYIDKFKNQGIEYPEPDIRSIWQSVLTRLRKYELVKFAESSALYERVSVEFEARMNPVWPMPGALETLNYFHDKGITQGIISNSQFYTPIVMEALTGYSLSELGLTEELLHWSFEEKMKKPGIEFYKTYIKKVNHFDPDIQPENILYVGNDMLKDIYPAHSIGMKTALFAGDKRSLKWHRDEKRCADIEPDLIITEFAQLKECIS